MYYRLGFARYALVATDHGLVLRKAGAQGPRVGDTKIENNVTYRFNQHSRWERVENAAAPGQMSLFGGLPTVQDQTHMPAAQAPAAPASHADMVHSAMAAHRGQIDALVAAHKGRIDGMNLAQLYDHVPDVEYDDYHVDSVNGLDAQIKGSVDPAHHQQIDKHFDDAYNKHKNFGYDGHVKELEKHHGKRIEAVEKQVEATKDKHLNGFQAFVDDTVSDEKISTLEEWNAAKDALGQKYKETLKAATSEITNLAGGSDLLDDFIEELHDAYKSALDEYSDDPEDW
jgi:hypothetical protein